MLLLHMHSGRNRGVCTGQGLQRRLFLTGTAMGMIEEHMNNHACMHKLGGSGGMQGEYTQESVLLQLQYVVLHSCMLLILVY